MLLLSWNVAGRVRRLEDQLARVLALEAELICLQEVTPTTLPPWRAALGAAGYAGIEHAQPPAAGVRRRPLMVLSAARQKLTRVPIAKLPWPERALGVRLSDGTEAVNLHSPISPVPGRAKVRTHLAVHRHLARRQARPRLLCGDLNTPRKEHADGSVWTFARDRYGRLRADRGADWEAAELALLRGLEEYGFRDAFRALHGFERREISWGWARWRGGYRLDHLLVSGLAIDSCEYRNDWRQEGLSDHAALVASLQPAGAKTAAGKAAAPRASASVPRH